MSLSMIALVLLAAMGICVPAMAGEHWQVYLLAGQSNMDGRARKSDLTGALSKYALPQKDVLIAYSNSTLRGPFATEGFVTLEPGFSVPPGSGKSTHSASAPATSPAPAATAATAPVAGARYHLPGRTFGPEISFGHTLADAMPGKHVALIKFSEGGTNLQKQWNPETRGMLYDQFLAFVRAQLQSITARGDTFTLAGLAWHQGESDASLSSDAYQALLKTLIARIRMDLDEPALPVVIGEVYDNHERDAVRAAQRAVAETVPHVFFATSAGLKTSDKGTHFDAASQIELGARMARALLSGKSITTRPSGL